MTASEMQAAYLKHDRRESTAALLGVLLSGLAYLFYPTPAPSQPLSIQGVAKVIGILAWISTLSCILAYVGSLYGKIRLIRLRPTIQKEVEDERYRTNRLLAQAWGFRVGGGATFIALILARKCPWVLSLEGLWILFALGAFTCTLMMLWLESPWREGN